MRGWTARGPIDPPVDGWHRAGPPARRRDVIVHNLGAAANLPAPVAHAAQDAFVDAFSRGMWLCAGVALAGALAAWTLIESSPARSAQPAVVPEG
jgi:hypothetical protein